MEIFEIKAYAIIETLQYGELRIYSVHKTLDEAKKDLEELCKGTIPDTSFSVSEVAYVGYQQVFTPPKYSGTIGPFYP